VGGCLDGWEEGWMGSVRPHRCGRAWMLAASPFSGPLGCPLMMLPPTPPRLTPRPEAVRGQLAGPDPRRPHRQRAVRRGGLGGWGVGGGSRGAIAAGCRGGLCAACEGSPAGIHSRPALPAPAAMSVLSHSPRCPPPPPHLTSILCAFVPISVEHICHNLLSPHRCPRIAVPAGVVPSDARVCSRVSQAGRHPDAAPAALLHEPQQAARLPVPGAVPRAAVGSCGAKEGAAWGGGESAGVAGVAEAACGLPQSKVLPPSTNPLPALPAHPPLASPASLPPPAATR
jgi:hypothetical protein